MGVLKSLLAGAALIAALPSTAAGHVAADPGRASAGAYQAVVFRVGHGCGEAATTALRIEVPAEMASARPQPKPGWTLEIERARLPAPVAGEGGRLLTERVVRITWRGRLEDDQFDTFGLLLKLPAGSGPLYLPTVQRCDRDETRWTETPAPGAAWNSVPHPAPVLTLSPAAPAEAPGHLHP